MKRFQNRTFTSILISWLVLAGLIFPCLLTGDEGANIFISGRLMEGASRNGQGQAPQEGDCHSRGNHPRSGPQYCCHESLVYARDEAQSAGEAGRFGKAGSLFVRIPPASLSNAFLLQNAEDRFPFGLRSLKPNSPDLFLLHSVLLI